MLILTLILLLILFDLKIHVNIRVSHDANLGARSSLFITSTTASRNCDVDKPMLYPRPVLVNHGASLITPLCFLLL